MNYSILHVITTINLGGAEKQLLTLATQQSERGVSVEVIFLKDRPALLKDFLEAGIKVHPSFAEVGFFKQILMLRRRRNQKQLVIHAHLPRAELLCAISLRSKSFVITRHNSEAFLPKGPAILSILLSRFVLKRSFASISISKAVASYLKSSLEINSLKTNHVIYYGMKSTSVIQRQKLKVQTQPIKLGTVSRLVPQKNLSLLLGTLKELNVMNPLYFELVVVGTGPLQKELQSISVKLGIENALCWKGQVQDMSAFYNSLEVFVLPSNYEGFGLVLLEAMSYGIPVIARRISAIPEVMGDLHPGLVGSNDPIDFANKIRELVYDQAALDRCLEYQAKRLEEFPIERTSAEHDLLYLKLLTKRDEKTL